MFIDVRQLAARWNISVTTAYRLRALGRTPPPVAIGNQFRWDLAALEMWERENLVAPDAATPQHGGDRA